MKLLVMLAASAAYAVGGICMKLSAGMTHRGWTLALFFSYVVGAAIQAWSMKGTELAVNYVIVLGFEGLLAALAGAWLFSEPLNAARGFGFVLILAGTAVLRVS